MSQYGRFRKARQRWFNRIFAPQSDEVDGWVIYQIHECPSPVKDGDYIDFYVRTRRDVLFVSLRKGPQNVVESRHSMEGPRDPIRVWVSMDFDQIGDLERERLVAAIRSSNVRTVKRSR